LPGVEATAAHTTLVDAGVLTESAALVPLSGGVSCDVWRVDLSGVTEGYRDGSPWGVVVKAPLARLRVPAVWQVDISRGAAETEGLRVMGALTPGAVPAVLWSQDDPPLLVMPFAEPDWHDWRDQMLTRPADDDVLTAGRLSRIGARLGAVLGTWHARTTDLASLPEVLRTGTRLRDLRTDPFHRATALEVPEWGDTLRDLAAELEASRDCLVHGDFSPKNVLVAAGDDPELWVLDAEVAHVGAPVFDLSYLATHLLLKAIHRPDLDSRLHGTHEAFAAAYQLQHPGLDLPTWARHTGAIVAARLRGVSRVTYLDEDGSRRALRVAGGLLTEEWSLARAWQEVMSR